MSLTLPKELAQNLIDRLSTVYETREAGNIVHELLHQQLGIDRVQLSINQAFELKAADQEQLETTIARLQKHEPLQHVLGATEFYGLHLKTDGRALIPRPETEELVHWILEENRNTGLEVLDIGTGTGCIPIVLAKEMNKAEVSAMDISSDALALASENAALNQVTVHFKQADILKQALDQSYDIIVSNPPYIPVADKAEMHTNVLEFEPGLALFVPDETPLLFYERIGYLAAQYLKPGGKLYFEIHHAYGQAVCDLLKDLGFDTVDLRKDLQGNDRMIKAIKA